MDAKDERRTKNLQTAKLCDEDIRRPCEGLSRSSGMPPRGGEGKLGSHYELGIRWPYDG
jgi:hypothetical protein